MEFIAVLWDSLVLGVVYTFIGLSFLYDHVSYGYLNISFGDVLVLATCIVMWVSQSYLGTLSPLVIIPIVVVVGFFRYGVHCAVKPLTERSPHAVVLGGLGIALLAASSVELYFPSRFLEKSIPEATVDFMYSGCLASSQLFTAQDLWQIAVGVVAATVLTGVRRTRHGQAFDLIRENRQLSEALHLPVAKTDLFNRSIAVLLASVAAWLYFVNNPLSPTAGLRLTIYGFVLSAAGGQKLTRIVVAGMGLGLLEKVIASSFFGAEFYLPVDSYWASHIAFVLLVVIAFAIPANRRQLRALSSA